MSDIQMITTSKIGYSQESIGSRFRDGGLVSTMIRDLKSGALDIYDIPTIRVYRTSNDNYFTHDHRRLYAMRKAGYRAVPCIITSKRVPGFKFTRQQGARGVAVRGAANYDYDEEEEDEDEDYYEDDTVCDKCERAFVNAHALWQHQQTCGRPRNVGCPICIKAKFCTAADAVKHVESGRCPHCTGKTNARNQIYKFVQSNKSAHQLLQPMLLDRSDRGKNDGAPDLPYKCHKCGRDFRQMSSLMQHAKDKHPQSKLTLGWGGI
eukprot:GEMP01039922.1.p1 GENE.GEMP01039922.1~~GEMP01039922.1.p1  ORF type:complete len:264 (+),score=56.07 GEMP01039922.1:53-844(+)